MLNLKRRLPSLLFKLFLFLLSQNVTKAIITNKIYISKKTNSKPFVPIDMVILKLNKPQLNARLRAIMWGLIKKKKRKKKKKRFIHRSRLMKIQSQHMPGKRKSQSAQRTLDSLSCLGMSLPCQSENHSTSLSFAMESN